MGDVVTDWQLQILDAWPPTTDLSSLAAGDIDGDGHLELVSGGGVLGPGALLWYRPATLERGLIAQGYFGVGVALHDLDGDGRLEVVAAHQHQTTDHLLWFKQGTSLYDPWTAHVLDASLPSGAHDLLFADVDGDGREELVANAIGVEAPGLYVYKPPADLSAAWTRYVIQEGRKEEGLAAGDIDGDGRIGILSGPRLYRPPLEGAFGGAWRAEEVAPELREMCRALLIDITGNGRLDAVLLESEYVDGRLSWFENCRSTDGETKWIGHQLGDGYVFGHSLQGWRDTTTGAVRLVVAEMAEGGWGAPHNWDARLVELASGDNGVAWEPRTIYRGAGTHEALLADVDGDGELEIVGKEWHNPKVEIWKRSTKPAPSYRHRFLDRDKPGLAIEILAVDIDGDGAADVACGAWWYHSPSWQRHVIPGISQVLCAYDVDGDGRDELIAIDAGTGRADLRKALSSDLCWIKPIDPLAGRWEKHLIGTGTGRGDWPHGSAVAPLLVDGSAALITSYHDVEDSSAYPELFRIPADPTQYPWPKQTLAELSFGEQLATHDIDGDGKLDIVAGATWLRNVGSDFEPYRIAAETFNACQTSVADVNGNGRADVVLGEFRLDWDNKLAPLVRLAWFENPGSDYHEPWEMHVVDKIRCPHSVSVADFDGDGEVEIVAGEHDPFRPYRNRGRLLLYKRAEPTGRSWRRFLIHEGSEHHCGAKPIGLGPGRVGIVSHGWTDTRYVHLWEPV